MKDHATYNFLAKVIRDNQGELFERLNELGLPGNRKELLFEILTGKCDIGFYENLDLHLYVVKQLYKEQFKLYGIKQHLYSSSEFYEYDPAKNGQNLIKHGVSFNEVTSYFRDFGNLIVRCPDGKDGERLVVFSEISLSGYGNKLSLPVGEIQHKEKVYVLSIVQQRGGKFRFISSTFLSSKIKKREERIKMAMKNIYPDEPTKRAEFVQRCLEVFENNFYLKKVV